MKNSETTEPERDGGPGQAPAPRQGKVRIPDRSLARSRQAARALAAIADAVGMEKAFLALDEAEDQVRRALLELYARSGRAPTIARIAGETRLKPGQVQTQLGKLERRDLVVLDADGERIVGAYPFSERDTGHRVRLGGRVLNAMCAIDALGSGAMYDQDVVIDSACRECDAPVHVETGERGTALALVSPAEAVVWSGIQYAEGRAATSLCRVLTFFCCDAHLESWRLANHPDIEGFRLLPGEAMEVGRGIFTHMLEPMAAARPGQGKS